MIPMPACPVPKIENKTQVWNDHDKETLKIAQEHCKKFYGKNTCVKYIEKTGDNSYKVLCFEPVRIQ